MSRSPIPLESPKISPLSPRVLSRTIDDWTQMQDGLVRMTGASNLNSRLNSRSSSRQRSPVPVPDRPLASETSLGPLLSVLTSQHEQVLSRLESLAAQQQQQMLACTMQLSRMEEAGDHGATQMSRMEEVLEAVQRAVHGPCAEALKPSSGNHFLESERTTAPIEEGDWELSGSHEVRRGLETPPSSAASRMVQRGVGESEDKFDDRRGDWEPREGIDKGMNGVSEDAEPTKDEVSLSSELKVVSSSAALKAEQFTDKDHHHLTMEELEDELPHWVWMENPRLMRILRNKEFEGVVAVSILANTALIGWEVNDDAVNPGKPHDKIETFQLIFVVLFTAELVLRLVAYRLAFFTCKEYLWNMLDLCLVGMSFGFIVAMDIAASAEASGQQANFSVIRLLRIARCARVLRIFRVSRFVGELRLMMYLILCSFRSLLWVFVLFIGIIYIFAVIFTKAAAETMMTNRMTGSEPIKGIEENYGSILASMFTLLKAAFGGGDWAELMAPLWEAGVLYALVFLLYELFMLLAVLNIVTGVFVENTQKCAKNDIDRVVQEELDGMKCSVHDLRDLFIQIKQAKSPADAFIEDQIEDGEVVSISREDFQEILTHQKTQAYFRVLGLDVEEGATLFSLLDTQSHDSITVDEFTEGCRRLRGGAKEIDIMTLIQGNKSVLASVAKLTKETNQEYQEVLAQTREMHEVEKRIIQASVEKSGKDARGGKRFLFEEI